MASNKSISTSVDVNITIDMASCEECGEELNIVDINSNTIGDTTYLDITISPCKQCCNDDAGALYAEINELKRQLRIANFGK